MKQKREPYKIPEYITEEFAHDTIGKIRNEMKKWLKGIDPLIDDLLLALVTLIMSTDTINCRKQLTPPNVLIYGRTGVGKTDSINAIAMAIKGTFETMQGDPEQQPSDIIGPEQVETAPDGTKKIVLRSLGPIFANLILVDEINRYRPGTKAVFLRPMEERILIRKAIFQGKEIKTAFPIFPISGNVFDTESPRFAIFFATQNIFEEEPGTYLSPQAELDRYAFSIDALPPKTVEDECAITAENILDTTIHQITTVPEIYGIGRFIFDSVKQSESALRLRTRLIRNTRPEQTEIQNSEIMKCIDTPIMPRVNLHLESVARTLAFMQGDKIVQERHVKEVAYKVFRHRLRLTETAIALGISKEEIIQDIINKTEVS